MFSIKNLGAIAVCFVLAQAASADYNNQDMSSACKESVDFFEGRRGLGMLGGMCGGYMLAMRDAFSVERGRIFGVCLPSAAVTPRQLVSIYYKWSQENPDRMHEYSFTGVVASLQAVYPCK